MSKHANSPFKKLPNDVLQNIHGFYTDKRKAHPTAELIKQLKFVYNPTYLLKAPPICLCVSWKRMNFLKKFLLSDFTEPDEYIKKSMKKQI